jgi:EAL domain-containing protein (putative c-di-GMP-specific phosphodiesterase class I)
MHYQPIVALEHQRTVGFEALVRWRNSEGKLIPPDRFISVAEETGLIVPMGMWIANRACQDFAIWKKSFDDTDDCSISINVSKLQLLESTFLQDLTRICDDAGLEPRHVNIEITETAVTNSPDQIICTLLELREKGFSIHMDDFGTGQSSLSFLHRFPIDVLKIDRSFVAAMVDNSENATIIEAIITLAQNLGKEITAEGIETESQMNRLIDMNCEYGQGYFFAKPGPADIALNKRGEGVPSKHLRGRTIAMQSDL